MPKNKPEAATPAEPKVDLLGQLSVNLGAEYMLRPSRSAISNIERETGKALAQLATQAGCLALSVDDMGVCVAEMMRAYGAANADASPDYKGAKAERCADLIYEAGSMGVARRIGVIFMGALTGGYTASGEVKAAGMTTEPTPTAG